MAAGIIGLTRGSPDRFDSRRGVMLASTKRRRERRMTSGEAKIPRTLHFKFTLAGASDQMIAMMKSSAPL